MAETATTSSFARPRVKRINELRRIVLRHPMCHAEDDGRLNKVREMPETLETLAARIDAFATLVSQRFDGLDQRLDGIDARFDGIDTRLVDLKTDHELRITALESREDTESTTDS
jgi:hypothetical protein